MSKIDYAYKDTHHYKLIKPIIHVLKHDELPKTLIDGDEGTMERLTGQIAQVCEYFKEVHEDGAHPVNDEEYRKWIIDLVDENVYYLCLGLAGIGPIGISGAGLNQPLNGFEREHGVVSEEVNGRSVRFLPGAPTSMSEQDELMDETITERVKDACDSAIECPLEKMYSLSPAVLHVHQVVMSYNMMRRDFLGYDTKRLIEFCDWALDTL